MAVVENAGGLDLGINVNVGSSSAPAPSTRPTFVPVDENHLRAARISSDPPPPYLQKQQQQQNNQSFHIKLFEKQQQQQLQQQMNAVSNQNQNQNHLGQVQFQQHNNNNNNNNGNSIHKSSSNGGTLAAAANSGFRNFHHQHQRSNSGSAVGEAGGEGFKRDMRELEDLLSKLNPMAQEFVPLSHANSIGSLGSGGGSGDFYAHNNFLVINGNNKIDNSYSADANTTRRKKNNYNQGKRRINSRTGMAQREEIIRRTVYVSDIDQQVTEEQLAALFINCGQVVDCRICGNPNSVLRFAFIEFTDDVEARAALSLSGTMLGYYPVRVLPSKTAIAPVNPTFLPRSEDEREMCVRTIYCTNIDKQVSQADVKLFFESICGTVYRLRLLGDYHHSTRIAFVEFVMAESAIAALNCSGVVLGSLPIRVSPSKTPVRPRAPRPQMH